MQITVNIFGTEELNRKFQRLSDKMQGSLIKKALIKSAEPIRRESRDTAPVADRVLTVKRKNKAAVKYQPGNLKKSIKIFRGKSKKWLNVQVGASTKGRYDGFYAHFVHEGHNKRGGGMTKANQWLKKAADSKKDEAVVIFENELNRIVENNFR